MKKAFIILLAIAFLQACNNSSSTTESTTPSTANPENVNGNVPDSASGTNLNSPLPIDSSKLKDSLNKK